MKTLNGQSLKQLLISGSNNLYNHYPEVDALNVFPVPDGDTGMNMNLTLTSGSKEISNRSDDSAFEIAKAFSRGHRTLPRTHSNVMSWTCCQRSCTEAAASGSCESGSWEQ